MLDSSSSNGVATRSLDVDAPSDEGIAEYRKRLLAYGDVVQAIITLTGQKER